MICYDHRRGRTCNLLIRSQTRCHFARRPMSASAQHAVYNTMLCRCFSSYKYYYIFIYDLEMVLMTCIGSCSPSSIQARRPSEKAYLLLRVSGIVQNDESGSPGPRMKRSVEDTSADSAKRRRRA